MTEVERLALAFFSCGASIFAFVDTVWRVSSAAFGRTASMTVLESLTVNLRELEVTAKGGECETISSRQVCTRPFRSSCKLTWLWWWWQDVHGGAERAGLRRRD